MKSPADYIIGFLFTVSSMIFWYGGLSVYFIQDFFVRYWWALLALGMAFSAGRFL